MMKEAISISVSISISISSSISFCIAISIAMSLSGDEFPGREANDDMLARVLAFSRIEKGLQKQTVIYCV